MFQHPQVCSQPRIHMKRYTSDPRWFYSPNSVRRRHRPTRKENIHSYRPIRTERPRTGLTEMGKRPPIAFVTAVPAHVQQCGSGEVEGKGGLGGMAARLHDGRLGNKFDFGGIRTFVSLCNVHRGPTSIPSDVVNPRLLLHPCNLRRHTFIPVGELWVHRIQVPNSIVYIEYIYLMSTTKMHLLHRKQKKSDISRSMDTISPD